MTGNIRAVKSEHFESLINDNKIVLVDFWAAWCAPCKQFAQVYEKTAQQYPDIVFSKINIGEEPDLAEVFQIRSIPHLMIFKEGIAIYSEPGSMPESTLIELVEQAKVVDISKIKEELEKEK
ncbi:thioredoxin proteins (plasmid) [Legionella adelaidensis]|uniref:Thioredoxin n=1 Tax=Legionella adelaidensis TaxID=45056 RepID=A0A0W0R4Y9_9GAMM|nr:thioredoxin family protein [Legionella adelaidensis]KTC66131.1 thioredoxin domain-containing protein [Legionella adelaidensis]VEH85643.1 thioredoxin proteins [Legionella adelaidensis]